MTTKEWEHLKKRVKNRKADFGEVDRIVAECERARQQAAEYHFLLDQIWKDDPILKPGPDTLAPEEATIQ